MGAIKDYAINEQDLEEFSDVWAEWRLVSRNITQASEHKVRDLHAAMSFQLSHKQMQVALVESKRDAQKVTTDLKESFLMANEEYKDSAVTIRKAVIKDDHRYRDEANKLMDLNMEATIIGGEVNALFTAVTSLSRELTARFKN